MTQVKELPPLSIRTNFLWTTFGNGIYLSSQWLILVILAKWGSPETVGKFSLGMALTAPLIILSQMQLRQNLITDVREDYHYLDNFWSRIIFTILALVAIAVMTCLVGYDQEMTIIICLISFAKAFESVSDIIYGGMQKFHRMDFIAISMTAKGIGTFLFFSIIMFFSRNLTYSIGGMVLVWGGVLFFYDLPMGKKFQSENQTSYKWSNRKFRNLVWETLPLALSSGLISFSGNVPRYFLDFFSGKEAVGLFSIAAAPLTFMTLLMSALGQAVMAKAAKNFQNRKFTEFKALAYKTTLLFFLTGSAITLGFALFGETILSILFSSKYTVVLPTLLIMASGITLNSLSVFGSLIFIGGRMFQMQFLSVLIPFIIQTISGYYLVKNHGNIGAGWTDFIKVFSQMLFIVIIGEIIFSRIKKEPPLDIPN